jgi:hypothetical protein
MIFATAASRIVADGDGSGEKAFHMSVTATSRKGARPISFEDPCVGVWFTYLRVQPRMCGIVPHFNVNAALRNRREGIVTTHYFQWSTIVPL